MGLVKGSPPTDATTVRQIKALLSTVTFQPAEPIDWVHVWLAVIRYGGRQRARQMAGSTSFRVARYL